MDATIDGREYSVDTDQRTSGQRRFKGLLADDFETCWNLITEHGFQTGWKKITGKPQHGNFNPNWKDCLDFVEAAIRHNKHMTEECPVLPILTGLPVCRADFGYTPFSREGWWAHMWAVCKLNQECVRLRRNAKRCGLIAMLYPLMPSPSMAFVKMMIGDVEVPVEEVE